MLEALREFFGFGGYERPVEGYMSWQHLVSVSVWFAIVIALAIWLGIVNKNKTEKEKNKVLVWTAIIIDGFEFFRIVMESFVRKDPTYWLYSLPLFLCSIQFITIPIAAFAKGRLKEVGLDFVFIFGILAAVMGLYFAGQNYGAYPVFSFYNVASAITHGISGFASLYIVISGMASMRKKNLPLTFAIMFGVSVLAYIANILLDYNYFFLMRGDGTPYDIIFNLVNGNPVIYPLIVVLLLVVYIFVFNGVYNLIKNKRAKKNAQENG